MRVLARSLLLEKREAMALVDRGETIGSQARITVRPYRSNDVVVQETVPVTARVFERQLGHLPGSSSCSAWSCPRPQQAVEVEVMIPTNGKDSLIYAEVLQSESALQVEVPFFVPHGPVRPPGRESALP